MTALGLLIWLVWTWLLANTDSRETGDYVIYCVGILSFLLSHIAHELYRIRVAIEKNKEE